MSTVCEKKSHFVRNAITALWGMYSGMMKKPLNYACPNCGAASEVERLSEDEARFIKGALARIESCNVLAGHDTLIEEGDDE